LLSAFAAMRVSAARSLPEGEKIVPGVKVADISVGGLSESEAMEKVRTWAKGRMQKPVTLIAPVSNRKWNLTLGECGGRFDSAAAVQEALTVGRGETIWEQLTLADSPRNKVITPKFALDENQLEKRLREIDRKVRVPARNVRIRLSGGVVKILASERNGIRVDIPSTKSALLNGDPQNLRDGGTAKLVIREEKPQITTTDVRKIDTLLASYRTDYSSSIPGRKHNVEMAIDRLNAALVADGDVFSYNDQIGERTESEGWQNAKMYKDGTVVDGMGAGICQVSSTLYNVALRADLPIVERAPHSLPVHYVPPGRDATVVYGATDFRFRNTTGGPIYISSSRDSGDVVIGIWGKKPTNPRRVRLITASLENLPDGGYRSKTYKEVTDSQGRVRREFLSTDTYHAPKPTPESDGKPMTRR
jgi:vancomycin resistance protein YoaR